MVEPRRYSQYANMFRRGKATSGAPICSGMIQLAKPANRGVANISSMIVPCIVNAWLNCSLDMICRPGLASSARISSAMTPPIRKNPNAVTRYSVPIVLWSVVVSHLMLLRSLTPRLCPRPARASHLTDARRITESGVTIAPVPDMNGT